VWGSAGIGKTQLLDDAQRAATASRSSVARLTVRPIHSLRPVGLIADLASKLMDAPGAAGCDPDAYRRLREPAEPNEAQQFHDVTELLAAVTEESPLVIGIDDAHIIDPESWRFWRALIRWSTDRRVLWLFAYRALHESELRSLPDQTVLPRLGLEAAGGNPLLVRAAAAPFDRELGARAEAAIDDTLSRLKSEALMIMHAVTTSDSVRVRDLARMLPLTPVQLRSTLTELLRAGIVHETGGIICAHACWADALLASYPMSSPPMSAAMMAF
jgi:hypothetical protein